MRSSPLVRRLFATIAPLFLAAPAFAQSAGTVTDTASPSAYVGGDAWASLRTACGTADARIDRAARALAASHARGEATDGRAVTNALRDAGDPHVWPRSAVLASKDLDLATAKEKLLPYFQGLAKSGGAGAVRRCGLGEARADDGTTHLAVIVVDAPAELVALPRQGRTGQWLTVEATFPEGATATDGKVVIVGPDGKPRTVPTSTTEKGIKARFALDRPGAFTVQVLATSEEGPRPVLEAPVFADVTPTNASSLPPALAPGEDAPLPPGTDAPHALATMANAARGQTVGTEKAAPLRWDPALATLAASHAAAMRAKGVLAHDVGNGDPAARLRAANVGFRYAGENVVRLGPGDGENRVGLAHRRLWESPSHRGNVLNAQYTRIGTAILVESDGTLWGVELFASDP